MSSGGNAAAIGKWLESADRFPASRYMGSKRRILPFLAEVLAAEEFQTVLDAFSGGGSVSYLLKVMGKTVHSNDYLAYSQVVALAAVANSHLTLGPDDLRVLARRTKKSPTFIQDTFNGLYFSPDDNAYLDLVSGNIEALDHPHKQALARAALCRSALKKQPRGVFTVVGQRYNDGRADLRMSMEEQFLASVAAYNEAVIDTGKECMASGEDIMCLAPRHYDLVYFDPPYYSLHSDNDYLRRYHFIEGLATYWKAVPILTDTKTKRLARRSTPFAAKRSIYAAFEELFSRFPTSTLVVSYSSNSLPTRAEMVEMLRQQGRSVDVFEVDLTYSFGTHAHKVGDNRNAVTEFLFVARP